MTKQVKKVTKQDLLINRGFKSTIMYGPSGEIEAAYSPFKESFEKIKLVWVFKDTPVSTAWTITIGHYALGKATTLNELDQILTDNNLSQYTES